jgi:hypothetical protein
MAGCMSPVTCASLIFKRDFPKEKSMEEKICKICGEKYIVLGLDVLERCVECIDKLEEYPIRWYQLWRRWN